jgi:hypothetical protein
MVKETDQAKQIECFAVNNIANGFYRLKLEQPKAAAV